MALVADLAAAGALAVLALALENLCGEPMSFLGRERAIIDRCCPGLDVALAALPLMEVEKPESQSIRLLCRHHVASLLVPAAFGGQGASVLEAICVLRALGARSPSLAVALAMHNLSVATMATYRMFGVHGQEVLKKIASRQQFIASGFAEGRSGHDILEYGTVATPVAGGYHVSGSKKPCSLTHSCSAIVLGVSLAHRPGGRGVVLVTIDDAGDDIPRTPFSSSPGVRRRQFWTAPFLIGADSHEVILESIFVPEHLMLFPRDNETLHQVTNFEIGGFCLFELFISAAYLGIVSGLVERAISKKVSQDSEKTLLGIEVESAMTMLEGLACRIAAEKPTHDLYAQALFVRFGVQEAIARAASRAAELIGGRGFVCTPDVGYLLASSRALAFHPPSRLSAGDLLVKHLMDRVPLSRDVA